MAGGLVADPMPLFGPGRDQLKSILAAQAGQRREQRGLDLVLLQVLQKLCIPLSRLRLRND